MKELLLGCSKEDEHKSIRSEMLLNARWSQYFCRLLMSISLEANALLSRWLSAGIQFMPLSNSPHQHPKHIPQPNVTVEESF